MRTKIPPPALDFELRKIVLHSASLNLLHGFHVARAITALSGN
jgi:hypothetical protein